MSTSAVTPAPVKQSFLKTFGARFKEMFSWLGNPKDQGIIVAGEALGEGVVDAIDPALAGIGPIINNWTQEAFKAETVAAAAGAADGTGSKKAAMVLNAIVPQILSFAQANGLSAPAAADTTAFNSALVNFLNAFGVPAPAPTA